MEKILRKKSVFLAIFLLACIHLAVVCFVSCAASSSQPKYRKISARQAKNMMDKNKSYILLDVRTKEEFREKHIKGALLIPDTEIKKRAAAELPNKNALILIYCLRGRRSANAARQLIEMGYTNVYDFGGIINWPYDTESAKNNP